MLATERIVTFSEATEHLPHFGGKKIHVSAVWRWARKGVRGVKLECRRVGGRFVTSVEALERFSRALADMDTSKSEHPKIPCPKIDKPRVPAGRATSVARAEQILRDAGISSN